MAKDFFGNEINVDDTVAFMLRGYRSLTTGTVKSITEQTVLIEHQHHNINDYMTTTRQQHNQVIVKK